MLQRTLLRALDQRTGRPVMAKMRGIPGRARSTVPAATVVSAGEPIYTGEELDLPAEMTAQEELAPHAWTRQRAVDAPRPHIDRGRVHAPQQQQQQQQQSAPHARRHSAPLPAGRREVPYRTPAPAARHADPEEDALDAEEEQQEGDEVYDEEHEEEGVAEEDHRSGRGHHDSGVKALASGEAHRRRDSSVASSSPALDAAAGGGAHKSKEAYRFLLDHIDAEIAALQRRHTAVTTRRQSLEERNAHRIKELFEFMESPWLLLGTEVPPPLPATGVDVYLKEQRIKKGLSSGNSGSGNNGGGQTEAHDKMFVLACHKNYRSLPQAERRFYEEAAQFNAAVRQELKYRLATGCARFETFCQQVKECTAEMARAGQVPELPATWHHANVGNSRYQGLSRWQRNARQAQAAAAHAAEAKGHDNTATVAEAGADEDVEEGHDKGGSAVGLKRPGKASQRIRAGAKGRGRKAVPAAAPSPPPPSAGEAARARGRKPSALTKPSRPAPKRGGGARATASKTTTAKGKTHATSKGARSASIPLPDLSKLAIKKIKKVTAKSSPRKSSKASKATPKKGGGGKGRKR